MGDHLGRARSLLEMGFVSADQRGRGHGIYQPPRVQQALNRRSIAHSPRRVRITIITLFTSSSDAQDAIGVHCGAPLWPSWGFDQAALATISRLRPSLITEICSALRSLYPAGDGSMV